MQDSERRLTGLGADERRPYGEELERHAELHRVCEGGVEIVVARYAGYCYGVERALRITEEALESADRPVATLGPIIHNPSVVAHLASRGVEVVEDVERADAGTIIVRTHGVSPEVAERARERGVDVVDATCPFVAVAQRKAAELRDGATGW